jgi:hypothetical protein
MCCSLMRQWFRCELMDFPSMHGFLYRRDSFVMPFLFQTTQTVRKCHLHENMLREQTQAGLTCVCTWYMNVCAYFNTPRLPSNFTPNVHTSDWQMQFIIAKYILFACIDLCFAIIPQGLFLRIYWLKMV